MGVRRGVNQKVWNDFPIRKEADGWHCRKCGVLLTGRKRSWCSKTCLTQVLLIVDWRYIRRCILRRDKYKCVLCGKWAQEVDHIIEMADGGSFHEPSNLRSLCYECHQSKTILQRKARANKKKAEKREENSVLTPDGLTAETKGLQWAKIFQKSK
jgi:5-methylcytosine-specific restriction endonuclease McrA